MASSIVYRGDLVPKEVGQYVICKIKQTITFVDWCPTGFRCGINYQPVKTIPGGEMASNKRDLVMFGNTSAIGAVLQRPGLDFDKMYEKRAFVHWFVTEGSEEGEMQEARANLADLTKDYEEVSDNGDDN